MSGNPTLRDRIAQALGWTTSEIGTFSLPTLRDLLRPSHPDLAQEISEIIRRGTHLTQR